jgi:hypothetical protein
MDSRRYSAVKLLKRYALSCLIALFIFSGIVGYRHPTNERIGALVVMAAVWPVVIAIAFGGAIGAVARAHTDEVIE